MNFHGLFKDEILSNKRFESYEESSKQNQSRMVTLFGQQVYSANVESFGSGNGQVKDIDLQLPTDLESVKCRELRGIGCSQDTKRFEMSLRIEESGTNWFGKKSEKVIISGESRLLDLNKTPISEPVSNHHQCFFQDLNFPYTEETEMSCEKSGLDDFMPICLGDVHEKDGVESPASCCTTENNSRSEEDACEVIQMAAECLVHISTVSLYQSQEFPSKLGSRSKDQDFQNKPAVAIEEPGRSYDSFELHTLGIRETSPEDVCCVSSKSKDESNNKKEVGVELRRGRRMKNFQKEILPGLVSLSRNEIREDINILEAVLRSREYKKMQGKTRDGKCRPNPRNNKDLIQRYVGKEGEEPNNRIPGFSVL